VIKNLVKVANRLDSLNLTKEADTLDTIIRKLSAELNPDITESLKGESDLYLESADPRWVDTSMPKTRSSNAPAAPDPLQSVVSYLDVENLEDPKDKRDFFSFLAGLIDNAEYLAKPSEDISFFGPPVIITRESKSNNFKEDRDFKRLYNKYGQTIIDALWKYIDEAAEILSGLKDPDPDKRRKADENLRELKKKITTLRN